MNLLKTLCELNFCNKHFFVVDSTLRRTGFKAVYSGPEPADFQALTKLFEIARTIQCEQSSYSFTINIFF